MSDRERKGREYPEVTLAIIAGGRGERLGGVAKGLLEVEGRTVVERVLGLGRLFGDVLLVANDAAPYVRFGVRTVADVVRGRGAPGGVHAALVGAETEWVLAVACDMPFVSEAAVRVLLDARTPEVDAVGFRVAGRVEPLLALYRKTLAGPWGETLRTREPSLRQLLSGSRTKLLPEAALRAVDAELRAVISVNTPGDAVRHGATLPPTPSPTGRGPG
ncbi:molybdenum cofactor guanylyltransferase [Archangium sp.]|uniref:molybdenum cofactor guanylyltransferase n=1 Tax=Archangium sp. TaxID=1872627 RepID=UPI00389A1701